MAKSKRTRGNWRFTIRSLLLLTLAVAAWLAYEIHESRTLPRHSEAIRTLGGDVELETSPWSLVRFVEPQRYGQRMVAARIPAHRLSDAMEILRAQGALRRLQIDCDGSHDVTSNWKAIADQLPGVAILPVMQGSPRGSSSLPEESLAPGGKPPRA